MMCVLGKSELHFRIILFDRHVIYDGSIPIKFSFIRIYSETRRRPVAISPNANKKLNSEQKQKNREYVAMQLVYLYVLDPEANYHVHHVQPTPMVVLRSANAVSANSVAGVLEKWFTQDDNGYGNIAKGSGEPVGDGCVLCTDDTP